jgi:hypothetical protein
MTEFVFLGGLKIFEKCGKFIHTKNKLFKHFSINRIIKFNK